MMTEQIDYWIFSLLLACCAAALVFATSLLSGQRNTTYNVKPLLGNDSNTLTVGDTRLVAQNFAERHVAIDPVTWEDPQGVWAQLCASPTTPNWPPKAPVFARFQRGDKESTLQQRSWGGGRCSRPSLLFPPLVPSTPSSPPFPPSPSPRAIPNQFVQLIDAASLPLAEQGLQDSFRWQHPGCVCSAFDRKRARDFLRRSAPAGTLAAFDKVDFFTGHAIFRLAWLHTVGGVAGEPNLRCESPLPLEDCDVLVVRDLQSRDLSRLFPGFLAARPGSPLILSALKAVVQWAHRADCSTPLEKLLGTAVNAYAGNVPDSAFSCGPPRLIHAERVCVWDHINAQVQDSAATVRVSCCGSLTRQTTFYEALSAAERSVMGGGGEGVEGEEKLVLHQTWDSLYLPPALFNTVRGNLRLYWKAGRRFATMEDRERDVLRIGGRPAFAVYTGLGGEGMAHYWALCCLVETGGVYVGCRTPLQRVLEDKELPFVDVKLGILACRPADPFFTLLLRVAEWSGDCLQDWLATAAVLWHDPFSGERA